MNNQAITWESIRLAPGVELLAGPNDLPLLYVGERQSYMRLSAGGADIVRLLAEGPSVAPEEISQMLVRQHPAGESEVRKRLDGFLKQLDEAGALAHNDEARDQPQRQSWLIRTVRGIAAKPRLTLYSWRLDRSLATGPLAWLKARAGNKVGKIVGLAALVALMAVLFAVVQGGVTLKHEHLSLPFMIVGLLLHAIFHELSHALVGSYYEVKIREFGIALLYYFLPVAYTDRTDAYRLRDFNSRAAIAMAGPMFDFYGAGISAVASCMTSGTLAVNFRLLMWLQIMTFISNLNPLMPGDGYHVLEAWLGALNFRRRAFSLLYRRLTFRELPPHLQGLDAAQQFGHLSYAVAALAYTVLLAILFTYNIGHIVALAFGR